MTHAERDDAPLALSLAALAGATSEPLLLVVLPVSVLPVSVLPVLVLPLLVLEWVSAAAVVLGDGGTLNVCSSV